LVRIDAVRHEAGDGARRVLLARVPGALQVVQNLLVQLAEVLALGEVNDVLGGRAKVPKPYLMAVVLDWRGDSKITGATPWFARQLRLGLEARERE
jgi:hypothetical protein